MNAVLGLVVVGAIAVTVLGVYLLIVGAIALVGWLVAVSARSSPRNAQPVRVALAGPGPSAAAPPTQRYFPAVPVACDAFDNARALEEAASRVFRAWASQQPKAPSDPGGLVRGIALRKRLIGRLTTRLDGRRFAWRAAPYQGAGQLTSRAPLDPSGLDPHRPPEDLRAQSRYLELCRACGGDGQCECPSCGGAGSVTCAGCDGAGKLPGLTRNGARRLLNCKTCKGKRTVGCASCSKGRIRCAACASTGRLERWLELEGGPRDADVQVEPDGDLTRAFSWGQDGVSATQDEITRDARVVCTVSRDRQIALEDLPPEVPPEWQRAHWQALQARLLPGERIIAQQLSLLEVPSVEVVYGLGSQQQSIELEGLRMLAPPLSADRVFTTRAAALRRLAWGLAAVPALVALVYVTRGSYFLTSGMLGVVGCTALAALVTYAVLERTSLGRPASKWLGASAVLLGVAVALALMIEPSESAARQHLRAGRVEEARAELVALGAPAHDPLWVDVYLHEARAQRTCEAAALHVAKMPAGAAQRGLAQTHADALALTSAEAAIAQQRFAEVERALACASEATRTGAAGRELRRRAMLAKARACMTSASWPCVFERADELAAAGAVPDAEALRSTARGQLRAALDEALIEANSAKDVSIRAERHGEVIELWARYLLPADGAEPAELRALRAAFASEQRTVARLEVIARRQREAQEQRRLQAEARQRQAEERQRQAEERAERRRQAQEERRERASDAGSVVCCDGSLSPSCMCGGSLRGCCSHH